MLDWAKGKRFSDNMEIYIIAVSESKGPCNRMISLMISLHSHCWFELDNVQKQVVV